MINMQRAIDRPSLYVSKEAIFILKTLVEAGYEAYIVGGAVRDLLLAQKEDQSASPIDYDFNTSATPEEVLKLFPEAFYENDFGTVMLPPDEAARQFGFEPSRITVEKEKSNRIIDLAKSKKIHVSLAESAQNFVDKTREISRNFEITTFRSDDSYSDFRRPDKISWGKTLNEDLERRDFTINAMAVEIAESVYTEIKPNSDANIILRADQYQIIDLHLGFEDLQKRIIRTVGSPNDRFQEDALRILRAIRMAVQLNLKIDDSTYSALKTHSNLLKHISWERISAEFLKMIASPQPKTAIEMLDDTNILSLILPELLEAKEVKQGGHHTTDVWVHSLDALEACPSKDPVVRLATLLHDIGKPRTQEYQGEQITFYNHEVVGSRMAKNIAARLRLSKKDQDRVFVLVRQHMFHYQPQNTDASIRRFMRKVGLQNIDDILDLREADRLGSGARRTSWRLEEMKERMIAQLNQPMEVRDLDIDGNDLMTEFSLKPGPILGTILNHLFENVLENPELNHKEKLLEMAEDYLRLDLEDNFSQTTNSGAATKVEE